MLEQKEDGYFHVSKKLEKPIELEQKPLTDFDNKLKQALNFNPKKGK